MDVRVPAGLLLAILIPLPLGAAAAPVEGGAGEGALPYERFETPDVCAECHVRFTQQHESAMMSQCFTHAWDEIEYFQLALPHTLKEPKVAGVKAG